MKNLMYAAGKIIIYKSSKSPEINTEYYCIILQLMLNEEHGTVFLYQIKPILQSVSDN